MANRNIASPTAEKIFRAWEREGRAERARTYLGASIIGHECDMWLWLNFRGAFHEMFSGRMYRLFNRGQREEAVFCSDLRKIGCEVKEVDDETGSQFSVSAFGGHFGGHLDGICRGLDEAPKQWFVTEFKTHSSSSFKKLAKEGVRSAKPMHFAQMTVYMGLTGLKKAIYMAVDKDTDDLWVETLDFDQAAYDRVMSRAKHIIDTASPDRCANRPDDYRCKACPAHSLCWHECKEIVDPTVPLTCRTCCHATADTEDEGAKWTCRLGMSCSTEKQACDKFLLLPTFVNGEIKDGSPTSITYRKGDKEFTQGVGGLSASELQKMSVDIVDKVKTVMDTIPGAKVVGNNYLEHQYASDAAMTKYEYDDTSKLREWCSANPFFDWAKPIRTDENGGVKCFEYSNGEDRALVCSTPRKSWIYTNLPPF